VCGGLLVIYMILFFGFFFRRENMIFKLFFFQEEETRTGEEQLEDKVKIKYNIVWEGWSTPLQPIRR